MKPKPPIHRIPARPFQLPCLLLLLTLAALSQEPSQRADFAHRFQQNAADLHQYTFKRRVTITVKGRSMERLESVRYVDGKTETVTLSTSPRPSATPEGRGLRGMMVKKKIEKKKEEMKEETEQLKALLARYTPGSEPMRQALEKAIITRTGTGPDAAISVEAKAIVVPKDSFRLSWSVSHQRPEKIEIQSELNKKPVKMTVTYASLDPGPFYAASTVLSLPQKDLLVTLETFDYQR